MKTKRLYVTPSKPTVNTHDLCRGLTSRVSIARPKRTYPCPQSPPCTSDTQSTRGDTCVLQPPAPQTDPRVNTVQMRKKVTQRGCRPALPFGEVCVALRVLPSSCPFSSDTVVTPASLSVCLESAMTSPAPSGLSFSSR